MKDKFNEEEINNNEEDNHHEIQLKDDKKEIIKKKVSKIEWIKEHKRLFLVSVSIILLFILLLTLSILNNNLVTINYDKEELIGKKYTEVEEKLESRGFRNVYIEKIADLKIEDEDKKELVTDIIIGDKNEFTSKSKFFQNKKITIICHTLEKVVVPITNKEAKGKHYEEVVEMYKNRGFVNVKTKKIPDLITGWIKRDGEVESVTIDGKDNYTNYDSYYIDTEVIVSYHTFKK